MTTSSVDDFAISSNPNSAFNFERPYSSVVCGVDSGVNGSYIEVDSPFTLTELKKMNRLTPDATAARARFSVAVVFAEV